MPGSPKKSMAAAQAFATDLATCGLKQERALQTRADILMAGAELFAERGFSAVTVLDIAQRAGVTKGAVYFNFSNKEAVAYAVALEFYARWPQLTDAVRALDLPPLDAIAEWLTRGAGMFKDDVVIQAGARLQIERTYTGLDLPTPYVGYFDLLRSLLAEAQERGDLPADGDTEAITRVLGCAFFGAQHITWVLNDRAEIEQWTRDILQLVRYRGV